VNVISLFSGCGGLDYGIEAAGWNIIYQNDFDRHSCDTLKLNGRMNAQCAPLEDVSTNDIRRYVGSTKDVDLVIGGPPCQPFSKSAYWSKGDTLRLKDPRADTINEYFRVIETFKPKAFLLENVRGINYNGKEEGFQLLIKKISEINRKTGTDYRPSWKALNAANFGVPQLRERFFLVALRGGKEFVFPEPTHFDTVQTRENYTLFNNNLLPYRTSWDALKNLHPDDDEKLKVGGKWGKLLPSIPEGENYLWHTDRKGGVPLFGWRTRFWCFLLKLAKNKPSWTIQAQPGSAIGPFHWDNRKLSWKELAALQTFPSDFRINASRAEIQRQIGNAVPSLLAEVLGRSLMKQVFGKTYKDPLILSIERNDAIPPPGRVQPVPDEYLSLKGIHEPHPGTGKGRIYQKPRDNTPIAIRN
jgi:DNA (cytosine-5)-methyltransferase 1